MARCLALDHQQRADCDKIAKQARYKVSRRNDNGIPRKREISEA
jgi:hypothetical protein